MKAMKVMKVTVDFLTLALYCRYFLASLTFTGIMCCPRGTKKTEIYLKIIEISAVFQACGQWYKVEHFLFQTAFVLVRPARAGRGNVQALFLYISL